MLHTLHKRIDEPMIAEQLHTRLLENMTTAVLLVDDEFRLKHINNAAETLLGLSGSRHQGHSLAELLVEPDSMLKVMRETLRHGTAHTERQAFLKTVSGGELIRSQVDYTVSPASDIDGSALVIEIQPIDRLMGINRDVSLVTSQSANHALLKGLAHEIKNPLSGLRGAAQLLQSELSDVNLLEYTQIIIAEADRLKSLVDRMLGPRRPMQRAKFNVHKVLERVSQLIETSTNISITLNKDYDPSIPDLLGDEDQLIQVFLNIAVNAIQAFEHQSDSQSQVAETDPSITLKSRIIRHFTIGKDIHKLVCCISIEDNGPGVPADIRDTLFVPMVSGHASNSGLGLAIAQTIVGRHSGLIVCESEPADTKFFIYLPIGS